MASILPPICPPFWSLWHTFGALLLTFAPLGALFAPLFAHGIAQVHFLWILGSPWLPPTGDSSVGAGTLGARENCKWHSWERFSYGFQTVLQFARYVRLCKATDLSQLPFFTCDFSHVWQELCKEVVQKLQGGQLRNALHALRPDTPAELYKYSAAD